MGIKRIIDTSFWTDTKVEEFSPEDKYFMFYLLTNPATTQLGIYEISYKRAAYELGYSIDTVKVLIERFENKYGLILFSQETNEIAIKNFLRHSVIKGGFAVWDCIIKEIRAVKDKVLIDKVFSHIKNMENLNPTVQNLIADYEKGNIRFYKEWQNDKENEIDNEIENENENDNENDNDNDVTYPVTGDVTINTQKTPPKNGQNEQNSQEAVEKSVENSIAPLKSNVLLSEDEISALLDVMGLGIFDYYVDRLSAWIKKNNANVSNHYETILKWYNEDKE